MKSYILLAAMFCGMLSAGTALADRNDRVAFRIDNRGDRIVYRDARRAPRVIVDSNSYRVLRPVRQANRFDRYNRRASRAFANGHYFNGVSVISQGQYRIYNGHNRFDRRFNRRLVRQNNRCGIR